MAKKKTNNLGLASEFNLDILNDKFNDPLKLSNTK